MRKRDLGHENNYELRESFETVQESNIRRSCGSRNPVKQPNPQGFSIYNATEVLAWRKPHFRCRKFIQTVYP